MAAAYLFHITQNHAFRDGNKRAGVLAALIFLLSNSIDELPDPVELEVVTMRVAAGACDKAGLTEWMRSRLGG